MTGLDLCIILRGVGLGYHMFESILLSNLITCSEGITHLTQSHNLDVGSRLDIPLLTLSGTKSELEMFDFDLKIGIGDCVNS
jgi:hypothetical protein